MGHSRFSGGYRVAGVGSQHRQGSGLKVRAAYLSRLYDMHAAKAIGQPRTMERSLVCPPRTCIQTIPDSYTLILV